MLRNNTIKENQSTTDLVGAKTLKTDERIELLGQLDEGSCFIMDFYHSISDKELKLK